MTFLLLWIFGFAGFMYLVMPLVIKFTQKMSAQPQFQPVDLSALPPPAAEYLWACREALESEGFETVGLFSWQNSAPNVFPLLALFMNRTTGVKSIAGTFYVVSAQGAKLTSRYVEFLTRYEDGVVLQTSNAPTFGALAANPQYQTLRVPDIQNPHEIYALHLRRMAQRTGAAVQPLPAPGTEMTVQQQRMVEDFEDQVKYGRLYLDRGAGAYRPTWKGAYLMTWSQLQPMKDIRKSQERKKSQAAIKELDAAPVKARV